MDRTTKTTKTTETNPRPPQAAAEPAPHLLEPPAAAESATHQSGPPGAPETTTHQPHPPPTDGSAPQWGAAQIAIPRHPRTKAHPTSTAARRPKHPHNHPFQKPSRGSTEDTHVRRHQRPWGSNPHTIPYPLMRTQNPRIPWKSRSSRHPANKLLAHTVAPAPLWSLHL